MFTGESLRPYPARGKASTGAPAEEFWGWVAAMAERWAAEQQQRGARPARRRAAGGGRRGARDLALRVAVVLTYLRRQVPPAAVGPLFRARQAAVSRELRAVLPALQPCLPCPAVWEPAGDAAAVPAAGGC